MALTQLDSLARPLELAAVSEHDAHGAAGGGATAAAAATATTVTATETETGLAAHQGQLHSVPHLWVVKSTIM